MESRLEFWDDFEEERVKLAAEYERLENGMKNGLSEWETESDVNDDNVCSKLLGWPDIIQNSMAMECELVSRGYYLGGTWEGISEQERSEAKNTAIDNWRLLFQLDIVEHEDFELMFGDCGRIYFHIKKEDLLARNFDKIWLILQCY